MPLMATQFEEGLACDVWRLSWLRPRVLFIPHFSQSFLTSFLASFLAFEICIVFPWMVSSFMSATFNVLFMIPSTSRDHDPPLLC